MPDNKCLTGGLQEYIPSPAKPWNEKRIHHLYNKLCNGAPPYLISAAKANKPSVLIDYLIGTAMSHPLPGEKKVGVRTYDYTYQWKEQNIAEDPNAYYKYLELVHMWFNGMITEGVRHKLVLFWSNHFVATADGAGNRPTWVFQYYYLLHKYAFGDFREFVKAIGLTPSMILYLNGNANVSGRPNENYARELLELFTMGVGNYTQKDVAETARALTGWNIKYYDAGGGNYVIGPTKIDEFVFYRYNHDWKGKVIFGKTVGNFGGVVPATEDEALIKAQTEYESLHDNVIFNVKKNEVAQFICKKLYKYYLYNDPPQEIIDGLATVFINSNFNIAEVLKTLFKSEHFFEDEAMGLVIKSHIDNQIHFFRSLDLEPGKDFFKYKWINNTFQAEVPDPANFPNSLNRDTLSNVYYATSNLGQTLFNPINVAGWPGYRAWLNEFTLVNRWKYNRDQFGYFLQYDRTKEKYRDFLKTLSGNVSDPDLIVRSVINYFITVELPEDIIQTAIGVFKSLVPSNYYTNGTWNLDYFTVPNQFIALVNYMVTLPEFQLL
ncbi:MAG: DUF1800 domain-containing protein [Saprospiraceae bacterium]|nr:DUF1800 domain-containing protein [Saprospiraceae bacterium]MBK8484179.1 DUF1800 domain-containing protein [Saprospiraceae bacterium]MBK9221583.1 DUF1800 domain-containing protein [Saprospiraceae bacterium]MBK9728544.1 DUF1800 domain-containing protein [Saprospiraceae bacterium]